MYIWSHEKGRAKDPCLGFRLPCPYRERSEKKVAQIAKVPEVPCKLDAVLVGSRNDEIISLVEEALSQTEIKALPTRKVNQLMLELYCQRIRIAIIDHSIAPKSIREALKDISQIRPSVSVIIIARGLADADAMDVEVGGCVQHLFTDIPSADHLRQFILSTCDFLLRRSENVPAQRSASEQEKSKATPVLSQVS